MVFIRPASIADLDPLLALAGQAGVGLTTLPPDRDLLRRRILKSQRSFKNIPDRPGGETYLFVMEDSRNARVVGASGIVSKVGGFEPFYAYRIEKSPLRSDLLKVNKEIATLHLVREHDGPAEAGSLFLAPDYRKSGNGRLLQLVRFLFVAEHRDAFDPLVVSELRGIINENGQSPFWEAVGKHFFEIDFPRADYLSVVNKKFIADLMPQYPVYVPLLPATAQEVIGQVHPESKPALKNLQAEGFTFSGMVDIFDAGACVSCPRDEIRTIRESSVAVVETVCESMADSPTFMMANIDKEFRACTGPIERTANGVRIERACASVLGIEPGARICFSTPRSASGNLGPT